MSGAGEARPLIGIFIPQVYPWELMVGFAQRLEALGFDSLWVSDYFCSPYDARAGWLECWTLLAGLAARTSRIRLGSGVSHVVYRNPALLARTALTVDHIANGRLELGLGAGAPGPFNYDMTGVPLPPPRERAARYAEAVALIRRLFSGEPVDFDGEFVRAKGAMLRPAPVQKPHPPLNLAAHGPHSLGVAARFGDAWNSFYPGENLSAQEGARVTAERGALLDRLAREAGRDPAAIRRTFFAGYTRDTPFASAQALRDFIGRYQAAGIQEFVFGFAPGMRELAPRWIVDEATLEDLARMVL